MIFYVALRNIMRNKKNTIIIFTLVFVINTLMVLGNNVLQEIDSGLKRSYVENFTGDILLKNISDLKYSIFGDDTPAVGEYFSIPSLNSYSDILPLLENEERIKSFESINSGKALLDINNQRIKVQLFGVEGESYFNFFKGIELNAGSFIEDGEAGLMISRSRAERIFTETGRYPLIGIMCFLPCTVITVSGYGKYLLPGYTVILQVLNLMMLCLQIVRH